MGSLPHSYVICKYFKYNQYTSNIRTLTVQICKWIHEIYVECAIISIVSLASLKIVTAVMQLQIKYLQLHYGGYNFGTPEYKKKRFKQLRNNIGFHKTLLFIEMEKRLLWCMYRSIKCIKFIEMNWHYKFIILRFHWKTCSLNMSLFCSIRSTNNKKVISNINSIHSICLSLYSL